METQPRRVLVVDDDEGIRECITLVLELDNLVVASVASGHDALTYLQGNARLTDLILLDLDLGDMTGEEVYLALCQRDGWADIPVLLMSASPRLAQTAQRLGVAAYVSKPFDPIMLQALVKQHARPSAEALPADGERQAGRKIAAPTDPIPNTRPPAAASWRSDPIR